MPTESPELALDFKGIGSGDLLEHMAKLPVARINNAIGRFKPKLVVGLFSGGHDSLSCNLVASEASRFDGCLHVNTGFGIEATRDFVRTTCDRQGWKLWEYKAVENTRADGTPDPMDYEAIVKEYGFPGPNAHRFMYVKLKDRCIQRFLRDVGASPESPILFISGARTEESDRRMGNTKTEPTNYGRSVWLNAIHDWTKSDTNRLIDGLQIERNIVVDLIHKSGECLCGAYAKPGEHAELKLWPQTRPDGSDEAVPVDMGRSPAEMVDRKERWPNIPARLRRTGIMGTTPVPRMQPESECALTRKLSDKHHETR